MSSQGNIQNGTTVNITFQVLNTHLPHKNRVPTVDTNRRPQLMRAIEEGLFEEHTHGTAQRIIMSGHTVDSRSAAENPSTAENRSIPSGGSGVGNEATREQNTTRSRPLAGLGDGEDVLIREVTAGNTEIIGNGVDISSEDANVESLGGSCCSG
ncbi:hypothetical protein BGX38DRAFT_1193696 [Terfezia claveryi]|nr:hypothetical protein BGX38DRAFT_1193696 [Terfezia claveryi]